jgi:hypothetical protein
MAIADLSALLNIATGGTGDKEYINYYVDNRIGSGAGAATVAGQYTSLWTFNRFPGGAGAAPGGTARNPTNTTQGALGQSTPTGTQYLGGLSIGANVAGIGTWYDRLADISGLNATTTTAQNTTSLAVTRYTGAESVGNEIWIEIYTIIGTTATTITVSYTNQAGTSGRTSQAVVFGGTGRREATRMIRVPLANGDTGVRSVESVTVLATTGTAGDFGVTIVRPIASGVCGLPGTGSLTDCLSQLAALPEIKSGACLTPLWFANTTTSPILHGFVSIVES